MSPSPRPAYLPPLEALVQADLAQLAAHRGLRQLAEGVQRVVHAVGGTHGVGHLAARRRGRKV